MITQHDKIVLATVRVMIGNQRAVAPDLDLIAQTTRLSVRQIKQNLINLQLAEMLLFEDDEYSITDKGKANLPSTEALKIIYKRLQEAKGKNKMSTSKKETTKKTVTKKKTAKKAPAKKKAATKKATKKAPAKKKAATKKATKKAPAKKAAAKKKVVKKAPAKKTAVKKVTSKTDKLPGQPKEGSGTQRVWAYMDAQVKKTGEQPTRKEVLANVSGISSSLAGVAMFTWRKAHQ